MHILACDRNHSLIHSLTQRLSVYSGMCPTDVSTSEELIDSQDEQLFDAILANQNHVLHQLLPPLSEVRLKDTYYAPVHITDSKIFYEVIHKYM